MKIAAVEAIQLVGAFNRPEWVVEKAPKLAPYREPSGEFWGAYGLRIDDQVFELVNKLRTDPWTRQAVAVLWDHFMDNVPDKLDYPCTVALGFMIRETVSRTRRLDMHVTMRSNDAWLGLPYDMFQFTQLQHTVARVLGVSPGTYTHTAWSLHLYERDLEASYEVTIPLEASSHFDPTGLGEPNMTNGYEDATWRARMIALEPELISWQLTPSERWYRDVIHKEA